MEVITIGFPWKLDYFELCRVFLQDLSGVEEVTFTRSDEAFKVEIVADENLTERIPLNVEVFPDNYKNSNKYHIYKILSVITGKVLPWGILTGIRPLKLIRKLRGEVAGEELYRLLREEYLFSQETIDLAMSVIRRQEPIINSLEEDSYSIYVDIPFCPTKCVYCSYMTYIPREQMVLSYVDALLRELEYFSKLMTKAPETIYIGGGTPSAIPVEQLEKIIAFIVEHFGTSREFTVEVGRPDTINRSLLNMLRDYGVDRISINPQSLNDSTLKTIGRSHSVKDTIAAYELAREYDFIINMDLILGLPGESEFELSESLNCIRKLQPDNLTIHSLALKKGSKLIKTGNLKADCYDEMYQLSRAFTDGEGYAPYYLYRQKRIVGNGENIGYAKDGFDSLYNVFMMEDVQNILGFGLSSISKIIVDDKLYRHFNPKDLSHYMEDEYLEVKYEFLKKYKWR